MNKMLPKKYLQQINYFELSIADPHKSVLTFTKVMSHRLLLFPLGSSLRHPQSCKMAAAFISPA